MRTYIFLIWKKKRLGHNTISSDVIVSNPIFFNWAIGGSHDFFSCNSIEIWFLYIIGHE